MIVVRIVGGLGNQMFQYAAGRALADRLGVNLALDLRDFENYRLHAYGLQRLRIGARIASAEELQRWPEWRRRVSRALIRVGIRIHPYFEPSLLYDSAWLSLGSVTHINGYFQSERYFSESADRLRDEFVPVEPLCSRNAEIAAIARGCESVAIHVRRGDYVSNAKTLSIHGVCGPEYYRQAISRMRTAGGRRFFVFSNDPMWARANLELGDDAVFVEGNERRPEIDIRLMASCRHHIIANSSFSWWGAWLGQHAQQHVIAPSPWFDSPKLSDRDLVPEAWTRIGKTLGDHAQAGTK